MNAKTFYAFSLSSDVLFIVAVNWTGAGLLEIPAVVIPRLYGEPSPR